MIDFLWDRNIIPIQEKDDKQAIKNCRPVSLLTICGKLFERLLCATMFDFFSKNNLLSSNQSGFRPGDSCINQPLSINHKILNAFDMVFEFRGIFLDISIAFDKILHDTLNFERQNGIINILQDFLSDRKQRAFLNGHYSSWADFRAGVTQGSIFRPLMFLIYIKDLPSDIKSKFKLSAERLILNQMISIMI